jgi:GNAT superfamily N-acetyltransferase
MALAYAGKHRFLPYQYLPMLHERLASTLARRAGVRGFRFFRRTLDSAAPPTIPRGLELRMLGERDAARLCRRAELDFQPAKLDAAFARGDLCAGAYESDELVGYCWFAFAPLPHLDGVWVDFHEEGVWMYKSLVLPSCRGRGIAPALYRFTDGLCLERRRKFSISCVETHNRPSVSSILRSGYTLAGYAAYLRRGRTLLTWTSPGAQRMAVRFYIPVA